MPQMNIVLVSSVGICEIPKEKVSVEIVGEKAFGLSCLPQSWTLPFIVLSKELIACYLDMEENKRGFLLQQWEQNICIALEKVDKFDSQTPLIIRSSSSIEDIRERGKYHSCPTIYANLRIQLEQCINALLRDEDIDIKEIPLIIQKHIKVSVATGHLSNERRCYKDSRDWLGEYLTSLGIQKEFTINLRNWRSKPNIAHFNQKDLQCILEPSIQAILKLPASWAYQNKIRVHYEWVWDGARIYIVQCDQETKKQGYNPKGISKEYSCKKSDFSPLVLREINSKEHARFNKIRNVLVYNELGFSTTKLYILDNQNTIKNLSNGVVDDDLRSDIQFLTENSLVIRTDLATNDNAKKQMLPRTHEERDAQKAIDWLIRNSKIIADNTQITDDIAFIFHNFIPAISSAFAFVEPRSRKVLIEALWGIPEGLYYYSHDKYIVDTKAINIDKINIDKISIEKKPNFKHYIVAPDEKGQWILQNVEQPFDWKDSIENDMWIKEIAAMSRVISEKEDKSLSIMWFIGVPESICASRIFPWHHEEYKFPKGSGRVARKKTPIEDSFTIRTSLDVGKLESNSVSNISEIRLQPSENDILRSKDVLKRIGDIAKKIDATIVLEGGVLSHAFYQLSQTGAAVEILHPFDKSDDSLEFNKLVRDKVHKNIGSAGEKVSIYRLKGDELLQALKLKLVEEAYEALDANDHDSIVEELADVSEVISGILKQLKVDKLELQRIQKNKALKAGEFNDGIVLVETKNPTVEDLGLLEDLPNDNNIAEVLRSPKIEQSIAKHSDKRRVHGVEEQLIEITVPSTLKTWKCDHNINLSIDDASNKSAVVQIEGNRTGQKIKIKVSVYKTHDQSLFDYKYIG